MTNESSTKALIEKLADESRRRRNSGALWFAGIIFAGKTVAALKYHAAHAAVVEVAW